MKVADIVEIQEDGSIFIPSRLAEIVGGLDAGTEVWFHPVKSIFFEPSTDPRGEPICRNELKLFISNINPRIWPFLYDVNVAMGDSIGSLEQVLSILSRMGIGVVMGESRTTLGTIRAEADLVLDFSRFKGTLEDLNNEFEQEIRKNPNLRGYIKAIERTVDKEIWVRGSQSPLQDLAIDNKEFAPGRAGIPGRDEIINLPTRSLYTFVKARNMIRLPQGLLEGCAKASGYSMVGSYAIMTASSETKMLQLTFPKTNAKIVQMIFYIKDGVESSSLVNLASFLVSKGFNFLETRMRVLEYARRGIWVVICDIKDSEYKEATSAEDLEQRLRNDILNASRDVGLFDNLNPIRGLKIYVPRKRKLHGPTEIRAFDFLSAFESDFRVLVQRQLEKEYHENWWERGVPPDVRERAEARIEKGKPKEKRSPMDFAELSDYEKIILRNDNWELFRTILRDKVWFHSRLSEIVDARNRLVHSGELTRKESRELKEATREILEKFADISLQRKQNSPSF